MDSSDWMIDGDVPTEGNPVVIVPAKAWPQDEWAPAITLKRAKEILDAAGQAHDFWTPQVGWEAHPFSEEGGTGWNFYAADDHGLMSETWYAAVYEDGHVRATVEYATGEDV